MMNRITQRSLALAVTLMLALATLAMSAPKSERSKKYMTIEGRVLQVNQKARTLLVSDIWKDQLYLVNVPDGETFKITFGLNMRLSQAEFEHVHRSDRVRIRCIRTDEHLARLDDGREVVVLTATAK